MTGNGERIQQPSKGDLAALYRSIYGNPSGEWAIIEGPIGLTPPPTLTLGKAHSGERTLHYFGSASDLFTRLHRAMPGARRQQAIADAIGTSQQNVSRFAAGTSEPRLTAEQWSTVVALYCEVASLSGSSPTTGANP